MEAAAQHMALSMEGRSLRNAIQALLVVLRPRRLRLGRSGSLIFRGTHGRGMGSVFTTGAGLDDLSGSPSAAQVQARGGLAAQVQAARRSSAWAGMRKAAAPSAGRGEGGALKFLAPSEGLQAADPGKENPVRVWQELDAGEGKAAICLLFGQDVSLHTVHPTVTYVTR